MVVDQTSRAWATCSADGTGHDDDDDRVKRSDGEGVRMRSASSSPAMIGSCTASAQEQHVRSARSAGSAQYSTLSTWGRAFGSAPPVPPPGTRLAPAPFQPRPRTPATAKARHRAVRSAPCRPHGRPSFSAPFATTASCGSGRQVVVRCGQLAVFPLHATPLALPACPCRPPAFCRSPSADRRLAEVTVRSG